MKQRWTVKIRIKVLSSFSSMWKRWQVKQEILCMHSNWKHPCSTLHPATEVTENASPTPLEPEFLGYSSKFPSTESGQQLKPTFLTPSSQFKLKTWVHTQVKSTACYKHGFLHCDRKTKHIPSKLTVHVRRPLGKIIHCFYHNLCRNSLIKFPQCHKNDRVTDPAQVGTSQHVGLRNLCNQLPRSNRGYIHM